MPIVWAFKNYEKAIIVWKEEKNSTISFLPPAQGYGNDWQNGPYGNGEIRWLDRWRQENIGLTVSVGNHLKTEKWNLCVVAKMLKCLAVLVVFKNCAVNHSARGKSWWWNRKTVSKIYWNTAASTAGEGEVVLKLGTNKYWEVSHPGQKAEWSRPLQHTGTYISVCSEAF